MANPLKRWTDEDLAIADRFNGRMFFSMHLNDERDETAMTELVRQRMHRRFARAGLREQKPPFSAGESSNG
jgi:hypothetical protein